MSLYAVGRRVGVNSRTPRVNGTIGAWRTRCFQFPSAMCDIAASNDPCKRRSQTDLHGHGDQVWCTGVAL